MEKRVLCYDLKGINVMGKIPLAVIFAISLLFILLGLYNVFCAVVYFSYPQYQADPNESLAYGILALLIGTPILCFFIKCLRLRKKGLLVVDDIFKNGVATTCTIVRISNHMELSLSRSGDARHMHSANLTYEFKEPANKTPTRRTIEGVPSIVSKKEC